MRRNFLCGRTATSLEDLTGQLRGWVWETANQRVHGTTRQLVFERWESEQATLQPLDNRLRTHGSVFDTITRATLDGLLVAEPASDLVSGLEACVEPLFDLVLALVQESTKLAEMRDYLLPRLLNGAVRLEIARG